MRAVIKVGDVPLRQPWQSKLLANIVISVIVGLGAFFFSPEPVDWHRFFYPALNTFMQGGNPYQNFGYFHGPWFLVVMAPLGLIDMMTGFFLLTCLSVFILLSLCDRMNIKVIHQIFILLSLPSIYLLLFAQVDLIILSGFLMPPPLRMLFLMIKPQAGIAVALYELYWGIKNRRWGQMAWIFTPTALLYLVSFLIFGFWPANVPVDWILPSKMNLSMWPASLMFGVPLLFYAIKEEKIHLSAVAGPFLSPYVGLSSWLPAVLFIDRHDLIPVVAAASWLIALATLYAQ